MRIGFDAKRIFFNRTGLGNYSRGVVEILDRYVPGLEMVLFSPREGNRFGFTIPEGVRVVYPQGIDGVFPSLWRSWCMAPDIRRADIDLFHGLSNEIPRDIRRAHVKSVVTIHDLIFERHPELYRPTDRWLYRSKYRRSVADADRVIAVSHQTKNDLVDLWGGAPEKIDVVYQGCSPIFYRRFEDEQRRMIRAKYRLPGRFLLCVGTVEERKNALSIVQAMVRGKLDLDLVLCGQLTHYADTIRTFARRNGIENRIHFVTNVQFADLPAIYQSAEMMIYPSFYEGFGIPILEGLNAGIPVITSEGGVFTETGGDAALYVDPKDVESLLAAIRRVQDDRDLRQSMIERGFVHAGRFREEHIARNLLETYQKLM